MCVIKWEGGEGEEHDYLNAHQSFPFQIIIYLLRTMESEQPHKRATLFDQIIRNLRPSPKDTSVFLVCLSISSLSLARFFLEWEWGGKKSQFLLQFYSIEDCLLKSFLSMSAFTIEHIRQPDHTFIGITVRVLICSFRIWSSDPNQLIVDHINFFLNSFSLQMKMYNGFNDKPFKRKKREIKVLRQRRGISSRV